jgi:AsmA-like C-terminal region
MRRVLRLGAVAGVFLVAAAAGIYVSSIVAPSRLRGAVERSLAEASRAPVQVARARLVFGFPVHVDVQGVRLWGGALRLGFARARLDPLALATGRLHLGRLVVEDVELHVSRSPEGIWSPAPLAEAAARGAPEPAEPALAPLQIAEDVARFVLEHPFLTDVIEVRGARVTCSWPGPPGSPPTEVKLVDVRGRLAHSRLRGDADVFLRARLEEGGRDRGGFEWAGERDRDGRLHLSWTASELDLSSLPRLLAGRGAPGLRGRLSGIVDFTTEAPGRGTLDLDLSARDVATRAQLAGQPEGVHARSLAARLRAVIDPSRVEISGARIASDDLELGLDAVVERPLDLDARAGLTLSLADLDLQRARALIAWLPDAARARALELARVVRAGTLRAVDVRGAAKIRRWRDVLAGRAEEVPRGLRLLVQLEGLSIALGGPDALEGVSGELRWSGDRLELHHARGELNGSPLPILDLEVAGISNLLASPPQRRRFDTRASALPGLTPLWEFLASGDEPDAPPPHVRLSLSVLEHPALLWPFRSLVADVDPDEGGVHVEVEKAEWAGVPVRGHLDWTFRPERRLEARFETAPAQSPAPQVEAEAAEPPGGVALPWADGVFEVGPYSGRHWRQGGARGGVTAIAGELHLHDVKVDLDPRGTLSGSASLDLTRDADVPFALSAHLKGGDVAGLLALGAGEGQLATGEVDLEGALAGALSPGEPPAEGLGGVLSIDARNGTIHRGVGPLMAVALASKSLGSFGARNRLRYAKATASVVLEDGVARTDALELDGPDLRLFASGSVDLAGADHRMEAELALFLFGQIDRALVKIPIVNDLLLGDDANMLAVYYEVGGPWGKPRAEARPLRTLRGGPIVGGIPRIVRRGLDAIGAILRPPAEGPAPPSPSASPSVAPPPVGES